MNMIKVTNSNQEFVVYNDNNLEHVLAGPDYGQPWTNSWTEENHIENIINKKYYFRGFSFCIYLNRS